MAGQTLTFGRHSKSNQGLKWSIFSWIRLYSVCVCVRVWHYRAWEECTLFSPCGSSMSHSLADSIPQPILMLQQAIKSGGFWGNYVKARPVKNPCGGLLGTHGYHMSLHLHIHPNPPRTVSCWPEFRLQYYYFTFNIFQAQTSYLHCLFFFSS